MLFTIWEEGIIMKTIRIFLLMLVLLVMVSSSVLAYNSLRIRNDTGKTIAHLYFAHAESDSWGPDRLNGYWRNGQIITLDVSKYRYWLFQIVFTDGQPITWNKNPIDTSRIYNMTLSKENNGDYCYYYNGEW